MAFQIPIGGKDIYRSSFFPQTNLDPEFVSSSADVVDDCVVKFTSLVRARD